jgi:hypothetical protein
MIETFKDTINEGIDKEMSELRSECLKVIETFKDTLGEDSVLGYLRS